MNFEHYNGELAIYPENHEDKEDLLATLYSGEDNVIILYLDDGVEIEKTEEPGFYAIKRKW